MKKKHIFLAAILGINVIVTAGCGNTNNSGESLSNTETSEGEIFDYKVSDYVTLGEYKNLSILYPVPVVSDDDVEMSIEEFLDENTEYNEISDRPAQDGDYINIDFTGTIDGEEFEGGTAQDYEFTLGQEEFIEEFEANVIGKNTGETFTFKMVFPDEYDEDLSGKTAEFTATLNSINEVVVPEYNDEFVKKATDYDTTAEYEEALREELMVSAQEESASVAGDDVLEKAVENATFNGYPQSLYDACYNETVEQYQSYADMFGVEYEEFMTDFMEEGDVESETLSWVNEILVSQAIAEQEGFEVTDEDYQEEAEALAVEYEYESVDDFISDYGELSVRVMIVRDKAIAFLYENAQIKEVSEDEYYGEDEEEELSDDDTELIIEEDTE